MQGSSNNRVSKKEIKMKTILKILAIAFIPLGIAFSETLEDTQESPAIETSESQTENSFEWFNGIRGYLGFSGGYIGSQYDPERKMIQTDKSYIFLKGKLPLQYAFKTLTFRDRNGTIHKLTPLRGYTLNLVFGAEALFLQNYLGLRLEGGVGYTDLSRTINSQGSPERKDLHSYLTTSLALDLIGNVYVSEQNTIGLFAGIETSYSFPIKATRINDGKVYDTTESVRNDEKMIDIFARLGVSTLLYNHHRVELIAKIPVGYVAFRPQKSKDFENFAANEKTSINVAYKYIF